MFSWYGVMLRFHLTIQDLPLCTYKTVVGRANNSAQKSPAESGYFIPVMNSLPFRVESSGFSCGRSIEFYSSETYFTLAASFPSRVGAAEFSEKKKTDE